MKFYSYSGIIQTAILFFAGLAFGASALAQSGGSLHGTVTDPSVSHAAVTLLIE